MSKNQRRKTSEIFLHPRLLSHSTTMSMIQSLKTVRRKERKAGRKVKAKKRR